MIRAIRPSAMAQDDAAMVPGWNVAPNVAYALRLLPGPASCGVLLYDTDNVLVATGAALAGTEQLCVLTPQTGQVIGMVDAELGWHLLITTIGTESQREIRIGPAVDLPDEIHPIYGDDGMALARATAAIDVATHYPEDVTATCPFGLGAGIRDVVAVPVDGVPVVGQAESITWTGTPDGAGEQAVIRRHVAIAPEVFIEPMPVTPPVVADDTAATDTATVVSGNVLINDESGLAVVAVNGLSASVGVAVDGTNGGIFTIAADGVWTFDPAGDFAGLSGSETANTSVSYYASDGEGEALATLTVAVSVVAGTLWTPAAISTALWLDASDATTIMQSSGITQWADKSGNNRHAAPPLATKPTYAASGIDGLGSVVFSSGADPLLVPSFASPTGAAGLLVAFVAEKAGEPVNYSNPLTFGAVNAQWSFILPKAGIGAANGESDCWFRNRSADASHVLSVNNFGVNVPRLVVGTIKDSDGMALLFDGNTEATRAPATHILGSAAALTIGSSPDSSYSGNRFQGRMGEIIIVYGDISIATRQKIEGYLAHKWGRTAQLPSAHPYKSVPPSA